VGQVTQRQQHARSRKKRVLFDNNVWSYIAQEHKGESLAKASKNIGFELLVAPILLVEASSNPNTSTRNATLRLMADQRWRRGRLLPEIACEADELIKIIRDVRPQWLLRHQRPRETEKWTRLWTRTKYDNALNDPDVIADDESWAMEPKGDIGARYRDSQLANRDPARSSGLLREFPDIWSQPLHANDPVPSGWDERIRVKAWTQFAADAWWQALFRARSTVVDPRQRNSSRDWTVPFLNLDAIRSDQASFNAMWWDDVRPAQAPRHWMRWAVGVLQLEREIQRSNAVDQALAVYLFEADTFVTADKRFAEILLRTVRHAPTGLAEIRPIEAGGSFTDRLVETLRERCST
jgi:hypothetical protein